MDIKKILAILGLIDVYFLKYLIYAAPNPLAISHDAKFYDYQIDSTPAFDFGFYKKTANAYSFRQNTPVKLNNQYDLITRSIFPYFSRPALARSNFNSHQPSKIDGWGDFTNSVYLTPAKVNRYFFWGFGPSLVIPSASRSELGFGKWMLGPRLALVTMPGHWAFGFITGNQWSFAGSHQRKDVALFTFQYYISYDLPQGWFITSQPVIAANWKAARDKRWVIPVGAGLGKFFHISNQSMIFTFSGYYNVQRPKDIGPNWFLNAKLELLFPFNKHTQNLNKLEHIPSW